VRSTVLAGRVAIAAQLGQMRADIVEMATEALDAACRFNAVEVCRVLAVLRPGLDADVRACVARKWRSIPGRAELEASARAAAPAVGHASVESWLTAGA
jgi:hypothetical protein